MSDYTVDRYEVEAMIRDALIGYVRESDLTALERDMTSDIKYTQRYLEDEIDSLKRVLHSRTEHLA